MLFIVNINSSGSTALKKWENVSPFIIKDTDNSKVFFLNGTESLQTIIKSALTAGETCYVSAGGDGTLNLMLNILINSADTELLSRITIGAVGLGSSNDFFKPFTDDDTVNNIHCKINFSNCSLRDVGKLCYVENGSIKSKYFLINASIGITAEANYFFNNPDFLLSHLKKKNSSAAIVYTALRNISRYNNFRINIFSMETGSFKTKVTNLAIIKNPCFSGNMSYGYEAKYDSGLFNLHLCENMNLKQRFALFYVLNNNKFFFLNNTTSWTSNYLTVSSEEKFAVEFEGEVITTGHAEFSVLHKFIKVCS